MKEIHKRNRNPKYKAKYKVINWREYEYSLKTEEMDSEFKPDFSISQKYLFNPI